jgi:hypothetical protein
MAEEHHEEHMTMAPFGGPQGARQRRTENHVGEGRECLGRPAGARARSSSASAIGRSAALRQQMRYEKRHMTRAAVVFGRWGSRHRRLAAEGQAPDRELILPRTTSRGTFSSHSPAQPIRIRSPVHCTARPALRSASVSLHCLSLFRSPTTTMAARVAA